MLAVQNASFDHGITGDVSISFDDIAYARADTIFVDTVSNEISALVDGVPINLGHVDADLALRLAEQSQIALRGPHPMGHELILIAALQTTHA